jgi:hypothetical protein
MTDALNKLDSQGSSGKIPPAYWNGTRLFFAAAMVLVGIAIGATMIYLRLPTDEAIGAARAKSARHQRPNAFSLNFDNLKVSAQSIKRGGPPKDGIPSLTEPKTVPVSEADFLNDDDRVIGITVDNHSRAYPIGVLNYHECINDQLGGLPIAVIYCPLCDSVSVLNRKLGNQVREFGISGLLLNSNVLLYDRTDQALWTQVGLQSISGPLAGKSLKHINNWELTTFGQWRKTHPDSSVVTFETGYKRRYKQNPYGDYFKDDALVFPVSSKSNRYKNKMRVIGVKLGATVIAYPVTAIQQSPKGVLQDKIGNNEIELRADAKTGAVQILKSPAKAQIVHTFWFTWFAFHPETKVYQAKNTSSK